MERYNYEQDESYIKRLWEYIDKLEEENKTLKKELHNTQLLLKTWMDDYMELEEENKKLKDKFMLRLAEAYLLPPTSNQMAEFKKRNFSKWYDVIKNQMRKEIKGGD